MFSLETGAKKGDFTDHNTINLTLHGAKKMMVNALHFNCLTD